MFGAFDDRSVTGTAGVDSTVALVPVVGFFVTGTSARIPAGGEISGYVNEDISLTFSPATAPAHITVAAPAAPEAPAAPAAAADASASPAAAPQL